MTTIQPDSEMIKKAVKWIAGEKKDNPGKSRLQLIEEASINFNLTPVEVEYIAKLTTSE